MSNYMYKITTAGFEKLEDGSDIILPEGTDTDRSKRIYEKWREGAMICRNIPYIKFSDLECCDDPEWQAEPQEGFWTHITCLRCEKRFNNCFISHMEKGVMRSVVDAMERRKEEYGASQLLSKETA